MINKMKKISADNMKIPKKLAKPHLQSILLVVLSVFLNFYIEEFFIQFFYERFPIYTTGNPLSSSWIFLSSLSNFEFILLVIPFFLGGIWIHDRLNWESFEAKHVKWFIIVCLFILTWQIVTFPHNYFYNQSFILDRLLLIVLVILSIFHPTWILFFSIEYCLLASQLNLSIFPSHGLMNPHLPLSLLFAVITFLFLRSIIKVRIWVLIHLFLVVIGANYFSAGLKKYHVSPGFLTWPFQLNIQFFFAKALFYGWIDWLEPTTINLINNHLQHFSPFVAASTYFLELGTLFSFVKRRLTIGILFALGLFHLGVFLLIGLFYWAWMVVVFSFGLLLIRLPERIYDRIFNKQQALLGIIIIFSLVYFGYIRTLTFGWWHVKYEYKYLYQAETVNGEKYILSKDNWTPYDYFFMGYSSFFDDYRLKRVLPTFADFQTSRLLNEQLSEPDNSLSNVKQKYAVNLFNQTKYQRFKTFLRRMANNRIRKPYPIVNYLSYIGPPQILSTHTTRRTYFFHEIPGTVEKINMLVREAVYRQGRYRTVNERKIDTVTL